jgi:hypothetical protein
VNRFLDAIDRFFGLGGDPNRIAILNTAKGQLWDAYQSAVSRVGGLADRVAEADCASDSAPIPVADLWENVHHIEDTSLSGSGDMPRFYAIRDVILQCGPYQSWKELYDLRMDVGRARVKAGRWNEDSRAIERLLKQIDEKLDQRAAELNEAESWTAAKTLSRALTESDEIELLNILLRAGSGQQFFEALLTGAAPIVAERMANSLEHFGLPKNFLKSLMKSQAPTTLWERLGQCSFWWWAILVLGLYKLSDKSIYAVVVTIGLAYAMRRLLKAQRSLALMGDRITDLENRQAVFCKECGSAFARANCAAFVICDNCLDVWPHDSTKRESAE